MEHPITPPPELVQQWATTDGTHHEDLATLLQSVATQAARWGDEQRLKACCEWLVASGWEGLAGRLRAAMRPKPPSLAEQALADLDTIQTHDGEGYQVAELSTIRAALERLQELENNG